MPVLTLDQFIAKYSGGKIDYDGAYGGQCVDLFRKYNQEVLGINQPKGVVGAADFWTNYETDPNLYNNFEKIPNTPDLIFKKGDVPIWNKKAGGGFGHVAVVSDDKGTKSSFNSFDQNWRALNICEVTEHNYTNVSGVLRPKKSSEMICHSKEKNDELITKATWYDNNKQEYESLKDKKTEFDQFKKTMEQKLDTLAENLGTVKDWDYVINASARFKSLDEKNLELQDKLDREIQAHKKTVLEYEDKLQVLKLEMKQLKVEQAKEIELLQIQHSKEIDAISAKVDKQIEELQKAKQQYEVTSGLFAWVKKLFKKGN